MKCSVVLKQEEVLGSFAGRHIIFTLITKIAKNLFFSTIRTDSMGVIYLYFKVLTLKRLFVLTVSIRSLGVGRTAPV